MPEEAEDASDNSSPSGAEPRNAFSSPQERTDYSGSRASSSPFGRPSKQQDLSRCILLGPHNLAKLFGNKHIIENSETLFVKTGYFNNSPKSTHLTSISGTLDNNLSGPKTVEELINALNQESRKNNNGEIVMDLLGELYGGIEKANAKESTRINSKMKIQILKCLYQYVELQNDELLLEIARIIFLVGT